MESLKEYFPREITLVDVSTTFLSRVPKFLDEIKEKENVILFLSKNIDNQNFLSKVHPTDIYFLFYKEKYISLPEPIPYDSLKQTLNDFLV